MMGRIGVCLWVGLAFALTLSARAAATVTAVDIATQQLVRADGSSITYYLTQRDPDRQSEQLLLVIQGSDCNSVSRIKAIPQYLSQVLPQADVLTVEKYGIDASLPYVDGIDRADCPVAYLRHDSLTQRAQDLEAVVADVLRTHAYRHVVAMGGSEGAVVAHLLAARSPHIAATIAFNGGGQWFMDDLLHSVRSEPMSVVQQGQAEQGMRDFIDHVRSQASKDLVVSDHGYLWWSDALALDHLALLKKISKPALIIQSGRDISVSPPAVLDMVAKLRISGSRNIHYRAYPELDHRLAAPDGTGRMPEVVNDMAAWLREILGEQ
ncbi:prolyl oligopeptidase family serine peptidase [Achromobacter sp.]|uniref:prolyl oligopeptidase family serine peptidase n=1 Tax=Achromobacter sp. TaxID=134375 RepID=UPI003C77AA0A